MINAEGRFVLRNACFHGRLAGWIHALASRQNLAEDDFVDLGSIHPGALKRGLKGCRAKLVRGSRGERTVERSDGGARGADDYDIFGHKRLLLPLTAACAPQSFLLS